MGLTNEVVKLIWMAGTEYAKDNGWIYTARFMSHALNGSGTSMNYDNDSALVKTIKKSKNFNNHMKKVQDLYNSTGHGLTGNDKIIEFTVDDIPDLYYSLQHVTINTHLLNDGRIYFEFSDKYDFTQYRSGAKLIIDAAVLSGKIPEKYFTGISKGDLANDVGTYALNNGIIHSFAINCSGYYGTKNSSNASSPIEKFVSVAESQIGYHEGNNNNTKYGAWYGLNYNPWCAMFVSWCAAQAGILYSVVPRYCYCPYGVNEYQSIGRFSSRNSGYIPKRGDVIFYQEGGVSSHTGIVTGVSGNTVYTVEGNTSDMVARRTHNLNDTYILGYGMCSGNGSFSSLTMLRIGSKGEAVRHIQNLLISRGYSCGASGADGDFGQGTYNAICAFQEANRLDVDGVVGSQTWNALYGCGNYSVNIGGSAGVQRFLDVARSQLGYVEGYENMTKYGAWYGSNGVAWCAMFVSWCAGQAGILGSLVPRYSWCESGASWYRARGRYRTRTSGYRPLPGDIIFYSHGSDYYHTGIVEYVNGNEVHTIEGNTSDAVRRRTYDISNSNINGYGLNGGIVSDKDNVLKEAGNIGLFKGKNINFPVFSKEVPIGVVSITPLITVSAKVSYQPTIASGKVYQVGSVSPTKLSAEVMGKFGCAGIECDLREIDLEELLKNVNANFTYGDILKYSFSIKSYKAIEISIEYKMKCINEDLYQTIIIMVEKGPDGSIRLPMPVRDNGSVVIQDYTAEIVIAGILTLAVGVIAESGLLAGFGVSKVVEEIITIAKVLS